jgi:WD40 repeat protein
VVRVVAFSPDGKIVLTGSWDNTARIWEVGRGKAVGPPLQHQGPVSAVAFSLDGKSVLTASDDRTLRRWEITPPVTGDVEQIKLWTEGLTGMELEKDETVRVLNAPEWENRRQLLRDLGGPPQDPTPKR